MNQTTKVTTSQDETSEASVFSRALSAIVQAHGSTLAVDRFIQPVAHPMHCGIDGISALVQDEETGTQFFLKVLLAEQALFCDFTATVEASTLAAEARLAPKLIAKDANCGALLYQALTDGWHFAMGPDLRKTTIREVVIKLKKDWHAQPPLSITQTTFERIHVLSKRFTNDLLNDGQDDVASESISIALPEGYAMMHDWITRIESGLAAAGVDSTPCHVENSLSNLMLGPNDQAQLVDFDRAANADPLADIGALCNDYCRSSDDIAQAAEIYAGQANHSIIQRIKLYMIAEDFYWGLWGRACHHLSRRRGIEFYKFGENHFLRCLHRLYAWDVDTLLRGL